MNAIPTVPTRVVSDTIKHLRFAGERRCECVVLWLAKKSAGRVSVVEAHLPEQTARQDVFRIPPNSMRSLMSYLGDKGLFIFSQVHSHPQEAFHSRADDTWAIVRHVGALSIVVPYFASGSSVSTFLSSSAVYELDSHNRWLKVPPSSVTSRLVIV